MSEPKLASADSPGSVTRILRQAEAALKLRGVDRIGAGAVVFGRPYVSNEGTIEIGKRFRLVSRPAVSHLVAMNGGSIRIGDRVLIECGASISCHLEIRVGDDVRIGSYVVIMDSDIHVVGDRGAHAIPQAVSIGRGVVIEHRVTILRGSRIGDGARVASGSVVSGDVPEGVVVAGVPATPLGTSTGNAEARLNVPELVQRVFGLSRPPGRMDGPDTIPQWDSLGALKLLLAIERNLGASLDDAEMRSVRSLARLEEIVSARLGRVATT